MLILAILGCGSTAETDVRETDVEVDAVVELIPDRDSALWDLPEPHLDLYGTVPAEAIPAPEFTVLNRDGAERTRNDLLGHPTVIWFYPAANTSG